MALELMPSERPPFDLQRHLKEKSHGCIREPLDLIIYDRIFHYIVNGLRESTESPDNNIGIEIIIIFGSWARRSEVYGPTAYSDLDLLLYREGLIKKEGKSLMKGIIYEGFKEFHQATGLYCPRIDILYEIDRNELIRIQGGTYYLTRSGYFIVSR